MVKKDPSSILSLFIKMNDRELHRLKMGPKHPLFMKDQIDNINSDGETWWQADLLTTALENSDFTALKELAANVGYNIQSIQAKELFELEYEGETFNLERVRVSIRYNNTINVTEVPKEIAALQTLKLVDIFEADSGINCADPSNFNNRVIDLVAAWLVFNGKAGKHVGENVLDYPVMPEAGYQRYLFSVNSEGDGYLRPELKKILTEEELTTIGDEPLFKDSDFNVGMRLLDTLGISTLKDLYVSGFGWVLLSPSISSRR